MKLVILLVLMAGFHPLRAERQAAAVSAHLPTLLVLDPVDLKNNSNSPQLGREFRKVFSKRDMWKIISRKQMESRFKEYNRDIKKPCKHLECAFDAASIFHAKYVLFSTVQLFEEYFIFSLNLIDISINQVIWSEVGEILIKCGDNSSEALIHRIGQLAKDVDVEKFRKTKIISKGTLSILNVSAPSEHAKVLFERLSTQTYTSGQYQFVGQEELDFILESLAVDLQMVEATEERIVPLGESLGVDFIIHFNLTREKKDLKLDLALFDIKEKKLVRKWPYKSGDFRKLLRFEDKFFSNMNIVETQDGKGKKGKKFKWKWIASPALLIAGGVLSYMAYEEHNHGDDLYNTWQDARLLPELENRPALESRIRNSRLKRNVLSGISGMVFTGSIVLFSF